MSILCLMVTVVKRKKNVRKQMNTESRDNRSNKYEKIVKKQKNGMSKMLIGLTVCDN